MGSLNMTREDMLFELYQAGISEEAARVAQRAVEMLQDLKYDLGSAIGRESEIYLQLQEERSKNAMLTARLEEIAIARGSDGH